MSGVSKPPGKFCLWALMIPVNVFVSICQSQFTIFFIRIKVHSLLFRPKKKSWRLTHCMKVILNLQWNRRRFCWKITQIDPGKNENLQNRYPSAGRFQYPTHLMGLIVRQLLKFSKTCFARSLFFFQQKNGRERQVTLQKRGKINIKSRK